MITNEKLIGLSFVKLGLGLFKKNERYLLHNYSTMEK